MGLADLKKNSTQSRAMNAPAQVQMSIDEFIEEFIDDATHYAAGKPEQARQLAQVIALETGFDGLFESRSKQDCGAFEQTALNLSAMEQSTFVSQPRKVIPKGDSPYRKATFTLSESAISHLAELASGCDIAKSKLIRFLIEHHYSLSEAERKQKESAVWVD
ncbi:CopG family transcriptional regulator [Shewanella sp. AS1]|uniref:CopG family transcriptional regulator n=1 Tax=Shewanella sp. AS1 TaxID=2907626 RepID=UPI001F34F1A5|nr:CopG family transcriptional regulator [Shewanella sp. AS1]MCE9679215.1 CopG family transcriptional regulator [Shewanella sp. AS1]